MKTSVLIKVEGHEAELKPFIKLCQYIQSFGAYGMSRTVHVNTDGDGSGRLSFTDMTSKEEFPNLDYDSIKKLEDELGEYNVDIGE